MGILKLLSDLAQDCYDHNVGLIVYPNNIDKTLEMTLLKNGFRLIIHKEIDKYVQTDMDEMKKFIKSN